MLSVKLPIRMCLVNPVISASLSLSYFTSTFPSFFTIFGSPLSITRTEAFLPTTQFLLFTTPPFFLHKTLLRDKLGL